MRSFFGSAAVLKRSESQKWVRVRRGYMFYYNNFFHFFLSVLVSLFVAWQLHKLLYEFMNDFQRKTLKILAKLLNIFSHRNVSENAP